MNVSRDSYSFLHLSEQWELALPDFFYYLKEIVSSGTVV